MGISDYRCPAMWDKDGHDSQAQRDLKLGWLKEAISEGNNFLKCQRAYPDIDRAHDLLFGPFEERVPQALSQINVNRLKRQIKEQVAVLSNLRPIWNYKTDNRQAEAQCVVLNKLLAAWFQGTFADRSLREALQYAAVEGIGYASPVWERDFWGTGRGDIELLTYGAKDVLPVQMPKKHDLQRCYAVPIRTEYPIAMAHAAWPEFADKIVPDRSQPGWFRRGLKKVERFLSPALNVTDQDRGDEEASGPVVDIYNVYILDRTVNKTGQVIPMGKPGTNWAYTVPYVGMDIPTGLIDPGTNQMLYRKANWQDALLYPGRRLLVATNKLILEDGPSPWWHGKVPLVPFRMDDWVFEFLGFSLVREGASIQASRNKLMRVMDDSANCRLRPTLAYDESLPKSDIDALDTRQPNQRIAVPMSMGRMIEPLLGADYYDVPAWVMAYMEKLESDQDYVMAHRDMAALARARQLPAADSLEKLFEVLGPIPQDQSRTMEKSLRELGEMLKYLSFQWYTTPRKVQIGGTGMILPEDYDYDPGNMIPARSEAEANEIYFRRVRQHAEQFTFQVAPLSAHQITQLGRQMIVMQLFRSGFPIDPWTMAEAFDLPNFGPPPEGTKNMIERWVAWIRMRGEMMGQMQAEAQAAAQGGGLAEAVASAMGANTPVGRPPSGSAPPTIKTKEGGARSTITESR